MLLFIFIRTNMGPTHFRNNKICISWGTYFGAKTSESFTRKDGLKVATPGFQLRKKPIFTSAEGLVSPLLILYRLYLLLKISSYGWVHMDKQLTLVGAYKQTKIGNYIKTLNLGTAGCGHMPD